MVRNLEIVELEEAGLGLSADHHHSLDHGGRRGGGGGSSSKVNDPIVRASSLQSARSRWGLLTLNRFCFFKKTRNCPNNELQNC
jgi:hypothetical protein